jgi:hypothetical protein
VQFLNLLDCYVLETEMEITEDELNEIFNAFTGKFQTFYDEARLEEREGGYVIWCRCSNGTKHSKIPLSFRNVKVVPTLWRIAK